MKKTLVISAIVLIAISFACIFIFGDTYTSETIISVEQSVE